MFLFMTTIVAQNDIKTLTLDFKERKFKNPETLDSLSDGQFYQLKITGINTLLYKISFHTKDTILYSDIKVPGFPTLDLDNLAKAFPSLSTLSNKSATLSMKQTQGSSKDSCKQRLKSEMSLIRNNIDTLEVLNNEMNDLIFDCKKELLTSKLEDTVFSNVKANYTLQELTRIDTLRSRTKKLYKTIRDASNSYFDWSKFNIGSCIAEDPILKRVDTLIDSTYLKEKTETQKLLSILNSDSITDLLNSLVIVENNRTHSFTSLPVKFNGDKGTLKILIEPRNENYNLPLYYTELHFPKQKNYFGISAAFYGSTLYNQSYSVLPIDSVTITVFDENPSKSEIGLAALLTYGWRFYGWKLCSKPIYVGGHLAFGPAVNISPKVNPRLAAGAGFSLGNKRMILVNVLFIAGFVDRLSSGVNTTGTPIPKPEQITVSKLKPGIAFSIGYLFNF
jgi:hypothetical protein